MPFDFDYFKEKRDLSPVWRDPQNNVWNVFRYTDVAAVLSDYTTFSSDFSEVIENRERAELAEGNMLVTDPPRHQQLRSLVSLAFSPRAIARMEGQIEVVAEQLLDQTEGSTHIELVSQFAYPLPVTVIARMLGVPASDRRRFKRWADGLLDRSLEPGDDQARGDAAAMSIRQFHDYLRNKVACRRLRQRHDLLSDLIDARINDQGLSDAEIVGFATILLIAGHITTSLLLGNAVLCLDEHPEVQAAIRTDFSAVPAALEETLRYCSPVRVTRRLTTRDVELGGVTIPSKQMVNAWLISANHDESQFDRPDEFVFDRTPNPHMGFGRGIHFCLGAPLARLESSVALWSLLRRYAWLRVDAARPPEMYPGLFFTGVRSLHLQVTSATAHAA